MATWARMKAVLKRVLVDRRLHRLAALGAVLTGCVVLTAWQSGVDAEMLGDGWEATQCWLAGNRWWLFMALVILPGFPVPTSMLLLLTGTVWVERPVVGCLVALAGIALNMVWTHWLAAGPGRKLVAKWLEALALRLPVIPAGDHVRMTLVFRLTPGVPFFLQNYLLGFFGVPFRIYLPLSLLCNGFLTCAFVLGGAGISSGRLGSAISGVSVLVAAVIGLRWIRARMVANRKRKN